MIIDSVFSQWKSKVDFDCWQNFSYLGPDVNLAISKIKFLKFFERSRIRINFLFCYFTNFWTFAQTTICELSSGKREKLDYRIKFNQK